MATNIADKKNNNLPVWGNEKTMNLNNLILTNILSSHYFKVNLYELKTYHEVIDEIYYKVSHLEPWEKGSRVTSGQTGMCGGVRGVGAGGIVSTAFCILYKLFTLKLTRKQVVGLINHTDSPYIRALGFMYIRYTQPPADLWEWYKPYLEDEEKIDVKAGGGKEMTIGDMLQHFLSKLEWFSTLFPRIPVPIQKQIEKNLSEWRLQNKGKIHSSSTAETREISPNRNHLDDDDMVQGSYNNGSYKHTSDGMKNSKHRIDPDDEREKRYKHDRERYEKSKHYHSGHGSRRRSRSSSDRRPHREDEKMHHSHHRDTSRHHRHRNHSRDRPSKSRKYSPEHYSSSHSRDMHSDSRHSHKRHHY